MAVHSSATAEDLAGASFAGQQETILNVITKTAKMDEESLQRTLLGEQIRDRVIEAIMTGEYKPGDRVVAKTLAERLGVSQSPVREALHDLVLLGFLDNIPFKGTSVRCFSEEELRGVYEVRAALESLGARLAAQRLTAEDAQGLRDTLDRMMAAAQAQDEESMIKLDSKFHEEIIRIAGNAMLQQVIKNLELGYWTNFTTRISGYTLEQLARRHETLLTALESGDPEMAMITMQHHIMNLANLGKNFDTKHGA